MCTCFNNNVLTILLEGVLHSGLEGGSGLTPVPVQHLQTCTAGGDIITAQQEVSLTPNSQPSGLRCFHCKWPPAAAACETTYV
jgi:hypothetical protein